MTTESLEPNTIDERSRLEITKREFKLGRDAAIHHAFTEQASILRFIENNWGLGRIGDASFDTRAGNLDGLFDFRHPRAQRLILNPDTGAPAN